MEMVFPINFEAPFIRVGDVPKCRYRSRNDLLQRCGACSVQWLINKWNSGKPLLIEKIYPSVRRDEQVGKSQSFRLSLTLIMNHIVTWFILYVEVRRIWVPEISASFPKWPIATIWYLQLSVAILRPYHLDNFRVGGVPKSRYRSRNDPLNRFGAYSIVWEVMKVILRPSDSFAPSDAWVNLFNK